METNVKAVLARCAYVGRTEISILHNAIKHGDADRVSIHLRADAGTVALTVTDNGRGLPKPVEEIEEGMGLSTIRSRADPIGAWFEITNRQAGGARITCTLSVSSASGESARGNETTS